MTVTTTDIAAALAAYQAGEGLCAVARRYHMADATLRRHLEAAGVPIRSKSEQCRLKALRQHASPLWEVTRDRWMELYWGPERPSLSTLAVQMSDLAGHHVSVKHLRAVLTHHGIAIRSPAEQLRIDGALGRRAEYGPPAFADLPPETQASVRAKVAAAKTGRRQSAAHRRNNGIAHRKSVTRPCAWCAAPVTRLPCLMRRVPPERTYCNLSCANHGMHWRRRFPDTPRPLVLARLRESLGGDPPTLARLERLAEPLGAGPREIEALALADLC